jgi:hypothetical protein
MKCVCGKELANELDTFGDHDHPMCWGCYAAGNDVDYSYYGLAPHHHDLERTGSIIGSTVFDSKDDPDFTPDPDDPSLGFWILRGVTGWR